MNKINHPLENAAEERAYAAQATSNGIAAYRRAVLATTGSLPTWLQRKRAGRKPKAAPEAL